MEPGNAETHILFKTVVYAVKVYSYQTGLFDARSSKGVKYVFIIYDYYSNTFFQIPSRAYLEKIFFMPIQHVINTSIIGYLISKFIG